MPTHIDPAALPLSAYFLTEASRAVVKARAAEIGADLAARRVLRATAQQLDVDLAERRQTIEPDRRASNDRRQTSDRRGLLTVEIGGQVVIQPRSDFTATDWSRVDRGRSS